MLSCSSYRRYRSNTLGQSDALLTRHALYLAICSRQIDREANYRALFANEIDVEQSTDIRIALQQSQPLGDTRFADMIERITGERREVRPAGRPMRVLTDEVESME